VDTVISNYRAEYSKAEKQKKLYKFMCTLATIAQTYNIAVVVTNQVNFSGHSGAANPSGGSVIRNEIPDTEEWQQYKENEAAAKEKVGLSAQRITDAIENPRENPEVVFKRTGKYPCGSKNKTQWLKHLKNQRRLEKQRRQEAQADWKLRMNAPIHLLEKTIREIDCRCEPEDMRQGVFCDTCRLF
jgi:Rad51